MKRARDIKILLFSFVLCLVSVYAHAIVDYPHFDINYIGCDSCHFVYGTQPSLLPPWTAHTPQNIDDTQYNTLCWSCHNDIDAPYMKTHSQSSDRQWLRRLDSRVQGLPQPALSETIKDIRKRKLSLLRDFNWGNDNNIDKNRSRLDCQCISGTRCISQRIPGEIQL